VGWNSCWRRHDGSKAERASRTTRKLPVSSSSRLASNGAIYLLHRVIVPITGTPGPKSTSESPNEISYELSCPPFDKGVMYQVLLERCQSQPFAPAFKPTEAPSSQSRERVGGVALHADNTLTWLIGPLHPRASLMLHRSGSRCWRKPECFVASPAACLRRSERDGTRDSRPMFHRISSQRLFKPCKGRRYAPVVHLKLRARALSVRQAQTTSN